MSIKDKERIKELEELNARFAELILEMHNRLQLKDERIEQLERVVDVLEREKWSIQSELENLRGY